VLSYLAAGCGFGGSCFPKDVKALVAHGEAVGASLPLLRAVLDVNEHQPAVLVERLCRHLDPAGQRVVVLGAAFKPGTDDVRESPTLTIVPALVDAGADVVVHDPIALDNAREALGLAAVTYVDDLDRALEGAAAVLLVTAWPEYRQVPQLLDGSTLVIDGRRLLEPSSVARYDGIGYPDRRRRSARAREHLAGAQLGSGQRGQREVLGRDVSRRERPRDGQAGSAWWTPRSSSGR
jgi:UDPglucose 6-dehydrogenase